MTQDRIEAATYAWAADKIGRAAEDILDVEFDIGDDGYCTTCSYPYPEVSITTKRQPKGSPVTSLSVRLTDLTMVDIVREISAFIPKED